MDKLHASGPDIGTASAPVIRQDGLFFKDTARAGALLAYENWRLGAGIRARDLAARLNVEEIAGLRMPPSSNGTLTAGQTFCCYLQRPDFSGEWP